MGALYSALRAMLTSKVVILAVGGALGTNARYWLAAWLNEASWRPQGTWLSSFPLGTFVINVTGSFVLGVVGIVFLERLPPEHRDWFLFLGTGLCGGYTTFSTFEWETLQLLRNGSWMLATVNVVGSVAVGFLGVVLGAAVGNMIFPRQ
jgi:CrcB protein